MWCNYHLTLLTANGVKITYIGVKRTYIGVDETSKAVRARKEFMKFTLNDLLTVPRSIKPDRRQFIGGSDPRIFMSLNEAALIRLWKEKRSEAEPEDVSRNLIVQLGAAKGNARTVVRCRASERGQASLFSRLGRFLRVGLAEAHAHSSAVFVDELDTTGFQAAAHHFQRCATRLMCAGLELAHSHDADPCSFREFLLAPIKEAASGATLC